MVGLKGYDAKTSSSQSYPLSVFQSLKEMSPLFWACEGVDLSWHSTELIITKYSTRRRSAAVLNSTASDALIVVVVYNRVASLLTLWCSWIGFRFGVDSQERKN